ncbi:helix-turn-helix transcriptional regulator [Clostridium sp. UBA4548]|uniref:helix-turn-helix transcriptional regulator n=1 Tax=Clostridium sp. UBA4548 TaxID=1946361 RepID=UPI0025C39743|nr:helix-turn-helix transcriptional regulator [Clostridium sp. UBA4548]
MSIGNNIKLYRNRKGLTQKELAIEIDKKEITVRKYESGAINPSMEVLNKIAGVLECSLFDLTTDVELLKKSVQTIEAEDSIILLAQQAGFTIKKEYDHDEDGEYLKSVYVLFKGKKFKLSGDDFHELSNRILDSIITNILASENWNLLK